MVNGKIRLRHIVSLLVEGIMQDGDIGAIRYTRWFHLFLYDTHPEYFSEINGKRIAPVGKERWYAAMPDQS